MVMSRDEYRQLMLAGTVTFPPVFPNLGRILLKEETIPQSIGTKDVQYVLEVIETPSARVTMKRKVFVSNVRAVFIPNDIDYVNLDDGTWLIGDEIESGLRLFLNQSQRSIYAIVYVAEHEPTLLVMQAGMTAAESIQYYPPLPNDRSHNHYNAGSYDINEAYPDDPIINAPIAEDLARSFSESVNSGERSIPALASSCERSIRSGSYSCERSIQSTTFSCERSIPVPQRARSRALPQSRTSCERGLPMSIYSCERSISAAMYSCERGISPKNASCERSIEPERPQRSRRRNSRQPKPNPNPLLNDNPIFPSEDV